jgi:ADP-ribosylglycohydrolase
MSSLSWVQPPDLVAHELVASAAEGKHVDDVRRRWAAAGGVVDAPRAGLAQEGDEGLRALAAELLAELAALPVDPAVLRDEPDDLAGIEAAWGLADRGPAADEGDHAARAAPGDLADRLHGAWLGRAVGCLLGKPVEKIPREGIREILVSQGRWPLDDWFTGAGLPAEVAARWPWNRRSAPTSLAENIDGMPEDDDLNFPLIALRVLERHGRDFSTDDVAAAWLADLPGGRVFTAERVAYRNLLLGESAPRTATRDNPYREWIGAWIRTDVYGWVNPGAPASAARMAHRDARLSHVRNGVYGAMAVAAMTAVAVVADDVGEVLDAGRAAVPPASRCAEALALGVDLAATGHGAEDALDVLHERYADLHWVHVLNNAALTAYALASSDGDLGAGISVAVTGGWDTDSVGATVGSVLGALSGAAAIPARWTEPLHDRVASSLPGCDGLTFTDLAARTAALVQR